MFYVMCSGESGSARTTEELGVLLRRLMKKLKHGNHRLFVAVGTEEAVMPYATFYNDGTPHWCAGLTGDCIRCGLEQNELPEDPDLMMVALERGDTVVQYGEGEQLVEQLDVDKVSTQFEQARAIAKKLLEDTLR